MQCVTREPRLSKTKTYRDQGTFFSLIQKKDLCCALFSPLSRSSQTLFTVIDLVTVFDAILTSRQMRAKLQCLYENLMSNNFRRTAVLKKI